MGRPFLVAANVAEGFGELPHKNYRSAARGSLMPHVQSLGTAQRVCLTGPTGMRGPGRTRSARSGKM